MQLGSMCISDEIMGIILPERSTAGHVLLRTRNPEQASCSIRCIAFDACSRAKVWILRKVDER